eukprot:SAG11_NODE_1856_length_4162_cov_4.778981_5_plen_116_part_00
MPFVCRHASSQNAHDFPRMALLGSFRNTAMEGSGPPVFFEDDAAAGVMVEHPSLGRVAGYRSAPEFSELRYAVPPMDDHWRFWGEEVKRCGGDEEVTGALCAQVGGTCPSFPARL